MPVVLAEPPIMAAEVAGSVERARPALGAVRRRGASRRPGVRSTWRAPLPSIGAGEPVSSAVDKLHDADAILVQDDGKPVGVLTRQDLLGFIAQV